MAAAVVAATSDNAPALDVATTTFDRAIAVHQSPDGSFGPAAPGEQGPAIQTTMFANELGEAYVVLASTLTPQQRTKWAASLSRAAQYLIRSGNLKWYANGNVALSNALTMALAARVSGNPAYEAYYKDALAFALSPPQNRWPGFGLHYIRLPNDSDGSDGAAYLAESGGGKPGFDADYTQVQADVASWIYLVRRDSSSLRLLNLLTNDLLPRVDKTRWELDTSGGTRHPTAPRSVNFSTPSIIVLAVDGGRTDLRSLVPVQFADIEKIYTEDTGLTNAGTYFAYGSQAATVVYILTRSGRVGP